MAVFQEELTEKLAVIRQNMPFLRQPALLPQVTEEIFRAAHTIKGSAAMLGYERITDLTHQLEHIFAEILAHRLEITDSLLDVLCAAVDALAALMGEITGGTARTVTLEPVLQQLKNCCPRTARRMIKMRGKLKCRPVRLVLPPPCAVLPRQTSVQAAPVAAGWRNRFFLRIGFEFDVVLKKARAFLLLDILQKYGVIRQARPPVSAILSGRYRQNIELFYDTSLGRSALKKLVLSVAEIRAAEVLLPPKKTNSIAAGGAGTVDLYFNRLPALVQDFARQMGKDVQLVLEGREVALNASAARMMGEVLLHLLRNAVDHGLEHPAQRAQSGKPTRGLITVSFRRADNGLLVIVADDGRGIRPDDLKKMAVLRGLINREQAAQMDAAQARELLFQPGFSTVSRHGVSMISGRGMGLDIVRRQMEAYGGAAEAGAADQGTVFVLKLPLKIL